MFGYRHIFNCEFLLGENCSDIFKQKCKPKCLKTWYFHNIIVKIAKRWGLSPQIPLPPAVGGSAPRSPCHSSYIVYSSPCICPQRTDSFGINQNTLLSCNYSGSASGFRRRKNYTAFRMPQITEIITIGFNFFVLSTHSFFVVAALAHVHLGFVALMKHGLTS